MEKSKSRSYYHWLIMVSAVLLCICCMGNSNILSPILPHLREKIGMSYTQVSLSTSIGSVCGLIAVYLTDKLYKKFSVRFGVILAFVCGITGVYIMSIATTYTMYLICCGLRQCCFAFGGMMPASILMRAWFTKRRGMGIGLCSAGSGITAMVLSTPITMSLNSGNTILETMRYWMIFMAIIGVIFVILVRDTPAQKGLLSYGEDEELDENTAKAAKPKRRSELQAAMSKKDTFLLLTGVFAIATLSMCTFGTFSLQANIAGYNTVVIGSALALFGGVQILGKSLYGFIADQIGTVRTNFIYFSLAILGLILFFLMDGQSIFYPYAIVIVMGLCVYTITTVGYPIIASELSDADNYARTLKRMQMTNTGAGFFLNPIAGMIADLTGSYRPFYIIVVFSLIYGLFIILFIRRRYVEPTDKTQPA